MLTKIKFKSYEHVTLVIVSMCHHVHWNILHGIKHEVIDVFTCIHTHTHTHTHTHIHAYASIIFVVYCYHIVGKFGKLTLFEDLVKKV